MPGERALDLRDRRVARDEAGVSLENLKVAPHAVLICVRPIVEVSGYVLDGAVEAVALGRVELLQLLVANAHFYRSAHAQCLAKMLREGIHIGWMDENANPAL